MFGSSFMQAVEHPKLVMVVKSVHTSTACMCRGTMLSLLCTVVSATPLHAYILLHVNDIWILCGCNIVPVSALCCYTTTLVCTCIFPSHILSFLLMSRGECLIPPGAGAFEDTDPLLALSDICSSSGNS